MEWSSRGRREEKRGGFELASNFEMDEGEKN